MAFQANDLDFYTGSHQTGEHLDIAKMHKDADITCYPAYRAVEWLTCYPASPAEVSELLASNKIEQSRAH
jgi:hypothetical protein